MGNIVSLNSPMLEKYIVAYLLKDKNFFLRVGKYLQTDHYNKKSRFENSKFQLIVNIICNFNKNYKKFPSRDEFIIFFDKMTEETAFKEIMVKTLDEVIGTDLSGVDPEYLKNETIKFIKTFRAVDATIENQVDIESGKMEGLAKRMQDAVNVNLDKDLGISIMDVDSTLSLIKEVQDDDSGISFGSPMLDSAIGNKAMAGELTVYCGVPGAGKTLWLGNGAIQTAKAGKKAAIFSLEVSKKRLSARIYQALFNKTKQELLDMTPETAKSAFSQSDMGDIRILNFQANTASCNDFAAALGDLKTYENWEPDSIYIDYTLICAANDKSMDRNDKYMYYKTVSEEMRNLGVQFECPVFTAAQINREGMGDKGGSKGMITSKDISESRGIIDTADYVLIIQQTAAEKIMNEKENKGKYRIFIDKNRNGQNGRQIPYVIDWNHLTLSEDHEKK
jgi:hypothetical protein